MITTILAFILGIGIGAGAVFFILKKKQSNMIAATKEAAEKEHEKNVLSMKQQFLASVSSELQEPMSQIITPLQLLENDNIPPTIQENVHQVLIYAQDLLHRVNMLIDFRNSGIQSTNEFKFVLPKVSVPKVVYVPLEKQQEAKVEAAEMLAAKAEKDATRSEAGKNTDNLKAENSAPVQDNTIATAEDKAQFLQRMLDKAEADKNLPPKSINEAVDDQNAGDAANLAWENNTMLGFDKEQDKHRFTMLVVDDAPDMCRFVRDYFRGEYNVITANNGEQALKRLKEEEQIDLVVSDITMPKMDGLELCRIIKTDLNLSHIPVILLTGRTAEEMQAESIKLGADDYITKPFNAETLRLRVKKFIERKAKRVKDFKDNEENNPSTLTITDVDEQFLQNVIQIVEAHLSNSEFSVEALGEEIGMSRTYLYKKLINITGKGPGDFIRLLRVKRGKHLLELGNLSVADVSVAVGYNSPKRFTENFKIEYDMSPSEYVRQYKAKNKKQ